MCWKHNQKDVEQEKNKLNKLLAESPQTNYTQDTKLTENKNTLHDYIQYSA